ncbi:MAG: hypothetical protein C5B51_28800 [Terriglobia bacterium]|nr:MAG: hypothetical protein C5B51_28800 [Terriglobia bacterium]
MTIGKKLILSAGTLIVVLLLTGLTVWNGQNTVTFMLLAVSLGVSGWIAVLVGKTNRGLQRMASELGESAKQIALAASQFGSSSQALAQGSSGQAASIEETSAAAEEIHSMARRNTDNSMSAAKLVAESQEKFAETKNSLDQMVTAMGEINASSDKISKIIKVIDEIAFQTNILALNAAVEAARAGEAGMGFAVVADEVRSLAQRCAQAARDTADLIEDSVSKSNSGKLKVDLVAAAIRSVSEEAARIKALVDEISTGSQEQSRGIEQIAKAITQMELGTQNAAASAGEGAATAGQLTSHSERLKQIVGELGDLVGAAPAFEGRAADPLRALALSVPPGGRRTGVNRTVGLPSENSGKPPFPSDTDETAWTMD